MKKYYKIVFPSYEVNFTVEGEFVKSIDVLADNIDLLDFIDKSASDLFDYLDENFEEYHIEKRER